MLRCPQCGYQGDTEAFSRFHKAPGFAKELNTVFRCPRKECKNVFSPKPASTLWDNLTSTEQSRTIEA